MPVMALQEPKGLIPHQERPPQVHPQGRHLRTVRHDGSISAVLLARCLLECSNMLKVRLAHADIQVRRFLCVRCWSFTAQEYPWIKIFQ